MDTTVAGQFTFYLLALVTGIGGTAHLLRKGKPVAIAIALVASGGFCGVGLYGPEFLEPYGDFLEPIIENASPDTYATFLHQVGKGEVPEPVRRAGLAFMQENPIEGQEKLFSEALKTATNPDGREVIQEASERYALEIDKTRVFTGTTDFKNLDEDKKRKAVSPLLPLDDSRIRRMRIDPDLIRKLRERNLGPRQ